VAVTITSRVFNQDAAGAKRAASQGPVFITDRGRPAHPVARLVRPADQPPGSVTHTIARQRRLNQGQSPGGISLAELRDLGRRTGQ